VGIVLWIVITLQKRLRRPAEGTAPGTGEVTE